MRDDVTTARMILKAAMAVTAAVLIVAVMLASLPLLFGGMTFEEEAPLTAEISGYDLMIDGTYSVSSTLPSDLTDLALRAELVDPINGSTVSVYEASGLRIPAASSVDVAIHAEVFLPIAAAVIKDLSDQDPFEIPLRIQMSGRYMFGLLGMSSEAVIALPVSAKGEDFSFECTASQSDVDVEILGLRENMVPPSDSVVMSCDGHRVYVGIESYGSHVALSVDSGGESLADAFAALVASYATGGPRVYSEVTGEEYDVDKTAMEAVGSLVGYMVRIYGGDSG